MMKERLIIFGALLLVFAVMLGLNAASYVQKVKEPDNEFEPNRSTYNPGATGTKAFYLLLEETGRQVSRWQMPPAALKTETSIRPKTFVVIGPYRRRFSDEDGSSLLGWVAEGGRLILIDRDPEDTMVVTTAEWNVSVTPQPEIDIVTVDPADQRQMTAGMPAIQPSLPSRLTAGVNAVQPSRFASSVRMERIENIELPEGEPVEDDTSSDYDEPISDSEPANAPTPAQTNDIGSVEPDGSPPVPTVANGSGTAASIGQETDEVNVSMDSFNAPVVHVSDGERALLARMAYGRGEIIVLADPFIVSNGGISMADNSQFGLNLVSAADGPIAFDEYHHGYGAGNNRLLEYFAGTPVAAIFVQALAVVGLALFSRSRRFGRPLPSSEPDRLTKLEYVSAMAELQKRTRAYDLALENVYGDLRRRVARLFGKDNLATSDNELAFLIAERAHLDAREVEQVLDRCSAIVEGDPSNKREVLGLVARLRELEAKLHISRQSFRVN